MQILFVTYFWHFFIQTVKSFLPDMIMQDMGHIVTVASLAGLTGSDRLVDYCSSKFAAVGFDESLRTELAVSQISFWSIIFHFNVALYAYFLKKLCLIDWWTERNQNDGITFILCWISKMFSRWIEFIGGMSISRQYSTFRGSQIKVLSIEITRIQCTWIKIYFFLNQGFYPLWNRKT